MALNLYALGMCIVSVIALASAIAFALGIRKKRQLAALANAEAQLIPKTR